MDQGMFMLRSKEIWDKKEITLLGPTASPIVEGRQFFQGPLVYYCLSLIGLFTNWDPVNISWMMVILGTLGMYFIYKTIRLLSDENSARIGALIYCFFPITVKFSNFVWNPNFLLVLTPIFLYCFVRAIKENSCLWSLGAGILAGMGLQFHFQFGPTILISGLYLSIKNRRCLMPFLFGLFVGYLPLIIFDLRNNFYNIRTIILWITSSHKENTQIQWHYVLSYIVILIVPIAILINKLEFKIKTAVIAVMIAIFISIIRLDINNDLTISSQNKIVHIILAEGCPSNYNVASTVTGDTRAYNLRYLLTIRGCPPEEVDKYPETKTLFLMAPVDRPIETETVWEVTSLGKIIVKQRTSINDKVILYELEKL